MRERRSVPMPRLAVKDQPYPDEEDHSDAEQAEQDKSGWATVRQIRPGGGSQTGRTASSDIVVVAILLLGIYAFAVVTGFEALAHPTNHPTSRGSVRRLHRPARRPRRHGRRNAE